MAERRRDLLVRLLLVVLVVGTYAAAQAIGTEEPLPTFLPLMGVAAYVAYKVGFWLFRGRTVAPLRVEFCYPVYVLRDPAGLVLCTEEPNGGHLAVFSGPDAAARFREVRNVHDWAPTPVSHAELLDLLHSARRSGRVDYVMIDPLLGHRGSTPVFPLSHCLECLHG